MIPVWAWLLGGGGLAWWLLKAPSSPASSVPAGYTSPALSVASGSSPTVTPQVVGWNQTQNVPALSQFTWLNLRNATVPAVGSQIAAQVVIVPDYLPSSGAFSVNGIVTGIDSQGNVSFQVAEDFPSASLQDDHPYRAGDVLTLPLAYVIPAGAYLGPGVFGSSQPQYQ